ncbi:MAG TPA: Ig-like domain-containing protein [Verrucomicrobiae bacterium]|nr:Ig-like domain-containing protein [Verrucomicrobiae bacterium]
MRLLSCLLCALVMGELVAFSEVIYPNADVYVETSTSGTVTTTYDGQAVSSQIVFGLAAANGVATGRRRSYLEFTIGDVPVTSAKLRLYNYWGANMGGGGNPAGSATIRLLGTQVGMPLQFSEPESPEVTTLVPPLESNFTTIVSGQLVDTVGWHEFDITSWYNARLGQTTTLLVRGVATSGFDFPLFEDRENTAYNVGAANTIPGSGPQIVLNGYPEPPPTQQLAFPGAEGFGAYAKGGRGGDVYYVTNLNDSGPGSLRNGITTANGPRTIAFGVSGNIALQSTLTINKPNITIAGQTAPGDGICIKDYSLNVANTHDVIVRGLRVRRGDVVVRATGRPTGSTGLDTVSIDDSSDVIFDHCSLSWSCDEIFGIVQNRNVTIQWCIISEPLGDPLSLIHPYGTNHAYGMNCSATTLSVHHNLIAKYVIRGPQFEANDASVSQGYEVWKEAVNNVLFDYRNSGSRYRTGVEEGAGNVPFRFHFIKNFYIRNPSRSSAQEIEVLTNFGVTNTVKVHVAGNIGPSRPNDNLDQWTLVKLDSGDVPIRQASADITNQMSDVPLFTPPVPVTEHSASNAYKQVISLAGYHQVRDAVDLRVISNVVNRQFYDFLQSQSQVGGWPVLNTYNVPADTDRDGMPDYWETALGKNPHVANHNSTNSDGYTDLEHYLNWLLEPRAVAVVNGFVDVNLRNYTQGMANNATYAVSNPTNGTVTLLGDGRTARFTPTPNYFGRASFRFVSTDTLAGGGMTNIVSVLVAPAVQPRFTNIQPSNGNVILNGSGGLPLANYYLLASTDAALPMSNWTRVATNQFDVSGNFSVTNTLDSGASQMFYRLEIP